MELPGGFTVGLGHFGCIGMDLRVDAGGGDDDDELDDDDVGER